MAVVKSGVRPRQATLEAPILPAHRGKRRRLIWRGCCQGSSLADVVVASGALSGRHERKGQLVDGGVRLIFEGCHLKTRYSSRLAV
jgi:hypothetical protein